MANVELTADRIERMSETPITLHFVDAQSNPYEFGIYTRMVCDCGADTGWLTLGTMWRKPVKAHRRASSLFLRVHRLCTRKS